MSNRASSRLTEGEIYSRKELQELFQTNDATIKNGVFPLKGYDSILLFVTENKPKNRTQYEDLLDDGILYWDGQKAGKTDRKIIEHEANGIELLVFYRKSQQEHPGSGFRYEGRFRYISHRGAHPAHFVLQHIPGATQRAPRQVREEPESYSPRPADPTQETPYYREGRLIQGLTTRHERNRALRKAAIHIHGTRCQVCDLALAELYGPLAGDYIEVHHKNPVAGYTGEVVVNPATDMAVLCPNCHRMLHHNRKEPLSVEELRAIVQANRKSSTNQRRLM